MCVSNIFLYLVGRVEFSFVSIEEASTAVNNINCTFSFITVYENGHVFCDGAKF